MYSFNIKSELLDITQAGSGNAKLLAISAILQGDRTVGQLSELFANISTDITTDGVLNDTSIQQVLLQSAYNLDLEEIRSNLEARYISLGLSVTIPDFIILKPRKQYGYLGMLKVYG